MITNNAICTHEIKSKIAMAKAAFNRKKTLFTSKLNLNLWKKLVKCYIWSTALCVAETRKVDQKSLESSETWCCKKMENIRWSDYVRNEEVLQRVKEKRNILPIIKGEDISCIGTSF
jgi:hypothetical protein